MVEARLASLPLAQVLNKPWLYPIVEFSGCRRRRSRRQFRAGWQLWAAFERWRYPIVRPIARLSWVENTEYVQGFLVDNLVSWLQGQVSNTKVFVQIL